MIQIAYVVGIIAIGLAVLRIFGTTTQTNAGKELQRRFLSLGNITGKSYDEIKKICGQPKEFEDLGDGTNKYTWQQQDYIISILFDKDNIAQKKVREVLPK